MLSKYFEIKTKEEAFIKNLNHIIEELKDKKVVLYGAGQGFEKLNKIYKFNENLNVIAITDKNFEKNHCKQFHNIRIIKPIDIINEDFDYILVINEQSKSIVRYLEYNLEIDEDKIKAIFVEEIRDEAVNLNYLYKYNFDKTYNKIVKKLNNKTIVLYGAGAFLEILAKYFDLSKLNIIGIADRRFEQHIEGETFLGYKALSPNEIRSVNPDYVLVGTKMYINVIEELYYKTLKDTKIKIKPLLKKSFLTLIKEIWE